MQQFKTTQSGWLDFIFLIHLGIYLVTTIKQTDDSGYFLNMPHKDFCITPLNMNMTWLRRIYMQETFQIDEEITCLYQYFRASYQMSKVKYWTQKTQRTCQNIWSVKDESNYTVKAASSVLTS